jgi:hypothetical protein
VYRLKVKTVSRRINPYEPKGVRHLFHVDSVDQRMLVRAVVEPVPLQLARFATQTRAAVMTRQLFG